MKIIEACPQCEGDGGKGCTFCGGAPLIDRVIEGALFIACVMMTASALLQLAGRT